jgi:DNA repair exonuclease SbcCD ATPase subunit
MAGLRFNIDADLTRFSQLVKKIQETRKELEKLSKSSPKYDKLYAEFKRIKSELETMQKKFAEIQAALAQVDLAKGVVESSKKIRKQTDETNETIKHYADSLNGVREQLKQVTNEINSMSEAQRKSVSGENAVKQYAGLKAQLKVAADEMRGFAKEQENIVKIQQASDGSLTQLRRQLSLLTVQYDNLSRDLRSGATGKELIVQIQAVTKELSEAEQASGRFYRNVGNYASGWNGLNVQVQQLARELPSLAVNMNTFFLAISNNLPMLIDEIKLAKDRLAELKKEGKEGTPVWKQLTKSLLSWQTALVVGITLLSSYGSEIADWVKGLFKAKENIDVLKESLKAYNETILEGRKAAQDQLTELQLLYDAAVDAAKGTDERTKAVKKLKDEYPDYFKSLDNEAILAGKAKSAYDSLTQSIIANAKARASMDAMTENFSKIIDLEPQINAEYSQIELLRKEYAKLQETIKKVESQTADPIALKGNQQLTALRAEATGIMDDIVEREEKIAKIRSEIYALNKRNAEIESEINISDLLFDTNTKKGKDNKSVQCLDTYQQKRAIQKAEQDIQDSITESQLNAQKMTIDLMAEGNAKELAQINANYDAKINEIRKRERELLQTLQNAEYEQWKQANPDYKKKGLQFTPTIVSLPAEHQSGFDKEYSNAYQQQQNDTAKLLSGVLAKYRDFAAQREAIEQKMNDDIAFLQSQRTEANSDAIDRAIKVAKDKAKEAVQAVTDEENKALAGQDNTFLKMLFGDVSQMAFSDLSDLIAQARQLRDYLSGKGDKDGIKFISPEQLKAIEESPAELEKLKKALDHLLGTGKKSDFEKIFDTFKKGFADLQSAKGFKDISGAIGTISGAAGDAAGKLSEMFDAMGNTAVADALGGVQQVMNAVSNIGQGFAKGGIVGGIAAAIGEAANFIGQAFSANQRHKEALKQVMNEAIAQQREYNLLLMQQNLLYEKATTIFGTDAYSKAANSVNVMKDAISELNEALKGTSEQQEKQNTKPILGRMIKGVKGYYSELKSLYAGLADVDIKTGHKKTGLFGWGKGKDIYSSILDVYPDLIDANGDFNKELAETIINTREMSDEDKAALQNMIGLAEQAEEAYEALNDYMTDIFGELGGSMSDALVDAFKNGTDAASAFADSVSDMLETLAEQMVYSVTLAPIMEEAQSAMLDVMKDTSLTDKQKYVQWTNILNGLVSDATEQQQIANSLYEAYQQAAKEQGFDIFKSDSSSQQSASGKGFETMSQDTADELNGRFTALYESNLRIEATGQQQAAAVNQLCSYISSLNIQSTGIYNIADESRTILANSYLELQGIRENTGEIIKPIKNISSKIDKIERKVQYL